MTTHNHTTKTCRTCRNRFANTADYGDPLGITPPGNPRLPWAPAAPHLPATVKGAARVLKVSEGQIYRWQGYGVELHTADQIAATLGHHPADLWPEYWDVGFRVCPTVGEPDEDVAA